MVITPTQTASLCVDGRLAMTVSVVLDPRVIRGPPPPRQIRDSPVTVGSSRSRRGPDGLNLEVSMCAATWPCSYE